MFESIILFTPILIALAFSFLFSYMAYKLYDRVTANIIFCINGYIVFSYFIKLIFYDISSIVLGFNEWSSMLLACAHTLFLCSLISGIGIVNMFSERVNKQPELAKRCKRIYREKDVNHNVILIFFIALSVLAVHSALVIYENGFGVLSRQQEGAPFVAGFYLRVQDRVLPIALIGIVIFLRLNNVKNWTYYLYFLGSIIVAILDSVVRLTKSPLLMLLLLYFIVMFDFKKIRYKEFIFYGFIGLVTIIFAFVSISSLRSQDEISILDAITAAYLRFVGIDEWLNISSYVLNTNFEGISLLNIDSPIDKYFTNLLGHPVYMNTTAPGMYGYFLLRFGVVYFLPVVLIFGLTIGFFLGVLKKMNFTKLSVMLPVFSVEIFPFIMDGNESLLSFSNSDILRLVGVFIFSIQFYFFLKFVNSASWRKCKNAHQSANKGVLITAQAVDLPNPATR